MANNSSTATGKTLTGCVKWFNNGLNYGFITVLSDGEHRNTDVFVHQSNIKTSRDCFRTLYTGECVQFELAKSDNEKHPIHAVSVQGFNGVQLRCEVPRVRGAFSGRGGRGGFRSAFRSGQGEQQSNGAIAGKDVAATQAKETPVEPVQDTVKENTTPEGTVAEAAPVAKGRGRGRGRKVNA
jgi:cold shock CspA family protein